MYQRQGSVTINDIHIIDDVFAVIKLLQKRHPTIVTTASSRLFQMGIRGHN